MSVCFLSAGPIEWGSSRMRCYWVAEHMEDATVFNLQELKRGSTLPRADVYIWQKQLIPQIAMELTRLGGVNYWDVCDPMWWFSPDSCEEILPCVDGEVITSNAALSGDFEKWSGRRAITIPDRIKPEHFPLFREHDTVSPVRFIWYGVSVNRVAIGAAWANLDRLAANGYLIELTIFDNAPSVPLFMGGQFPVYYKEWTMREENAVISAHDIALLPEYPGPWGRVKSDNKTVTAWANGLPVIGDAPYVTYERMMDPGFRKSFVYRDEVMRGRNAEISAREWEAVIENRNL